MPMDVDGKLLAEGQLHEGLVLPAPKEREGAAQHDGDERGQRVEHGRIVRAAGFEREPESRAVAGLSSTDEGESGSAKTRAKSVRTNNGNRHPAWGTNLGLWAVDTLVTAVVCGACGWVVAAWAADQGLGLLAWLRAGRPCRPIATQYKIWWTFLPIA
jgi:hypothetical protein